MHENFIWLARDLWGGRFCGSLCFLCAPHAAQRELQISEIPVAGVGEQRTPTPHLLVPRSTVAAPLTPTSSSLPGSQQGRCQDWGRGFLGMGKRCSCCAKMTRHFLWSWCELVHMRATPGLLQPALRPRTVMIQQPQKDTADLKRRCSHNPTGRSKATHWCCQLPFAMQSTQRFG